MVLKPNFNLNKFNSKIINKFSHARADSSEISTKKKKIFLNET